MLKNYKIGEHTYPVKFDHFAFYDYEVQTGRPLAQDFGKVALALQQDVARMPIPVLSEIILCGIVSGAREAGSSNLPHLANLTSRDIGGLIWQDLDHMTKASQILEQLAEAMPRDKKEQNKQAKAPEAKPEGEA